jgi:Bacterial Ig domain
VATPTPEPPPTAAPTPDPGPTPREPRPTPNPTPVPTPLPTPTPTPTPPPTTTSGCGGERTAPSTRITAPSAGSHVTRSPISISASASDNVGVTKVEFYYHLDVAGTSDGVVAAADPPRFIAAVKNPPYAITWALPSTCGALVSFSSRAYDACDNVGISSDVQVNICTKTAAPAMGTVGWTSHLDVPGAEAQVVVNGSAALFLSEGQSAGTLAVDGRELRVEAQIVRAAGTPGTWRLSFAGAGVRASGLRVQAGQPLDVQPGEVRFQLAGKAGERVVFTVALE